LVVFFSLPAWLAFTKPSVADPDVWWHLRAGQWIVQHHWVPYNDWFSTYGMGKPWAAYSWLFDLLIYELFNRFGLIGIAIYVYVLLLGIAAAFFFLVRKFERRLAQSIILAAAGVFALAHMRTPRPWLFTIFFFAIELNVLVVVRRSRDYRLLFYLVPLFAAWANVHIQFVYGLGVLGLLVLEEPICRLLRREAVGEDQPVPLKWSLAVIAASTLAAVINPYHIWIYYWVIDTIKLSGLDQFVSEMQAMDFRSLPDWFVLALTLAAAFSIGRRRNVAPFWLLLLGTGIVLSFRSKRDVWFLTSVAITVIPLTCSVLSANITDQISRGQTIAVAIASVALIVFVIIISEISNSKLEQSVAQEFPVAAADFVDQHQLAGPMYNHFDWGGYLMWRLPRLPVGIDGRSNIHRVDRITHSVEVWNGKPGWESDPELSFAQVVIAERRLTLAQLLRVDQHFQKVYEDEIAVVFVRHAQ
jgi:hypothetical protein